MQRVSYITFKPFGFANQSEQFKWKRYKVEAQRAILQEDCQEKKLLTRSPKLDLILIQKHHLWSKRNFALAVGTGKTNKARPK